ncbi:superoxide dismutase family protein [Escherichia coli]|uniref:superoxide dismutase family protein n=1 Tax=Escherichia coli TaxID=562 RepID=UPI0005CE1D2F|nr:superoxide dismutase family protein [Escherichia coli]EEZ9831432.1 superoxide dismutase family protein [Escherichia coli O153]EFW0662341.1 superoxide dismutase family protein [Shigella dysenteriae]AUJ98456.1 superoxide dismutase [Escherichia coli]EAA1683048.1 superoxide dismutase [Escherichia coli]EEV4115808.1 superoxide dismutase family protein [Escherichia coli]
MKCNVIGAIAILAASSCGYAATKEVPMNLVNSDGKELPIGKITIQETLYGLLFTPELHSLPEGIHGFHVHENGSCAPVLKDGKPVAALSAGGHFDPKKTGKHLGPWSPDGHLGDLPALYVTNDGKANYPVLAPKLTELKDINGHSLMIHIGGDNHHDNPEPLGGGGARIACGIIP